MPRSVALAALAVLALAVTAASGRSLAQQGQNFADSLNNRGGGGGGGGNGNNGNGNNNGRPWQNGNNNNNNNAPAPGPAAAAPSPSDSPPEILAGPSGKVKDNGSGAEGLPSNDAARSDSRGAKAVAPTQLGIKGTGAQQKDESGKGLITGTPIDIESAKSQNGARQASSASFADDLNSAGENSGGGQLRGAPAWGGGSGGGGNYPLYWLNANVYTIPRYDPGAFGFLGSILGFGASQVVTIVLDNWSAKIPSWGPSPVFKAPAVGYTFAWSLYEYRWYASRYGGNWGWKSPPLGLVMYDQLNNRLEAEVFVGLNLRTWEVVSVNVANTWFAGNQWG
jgi:hypothetical protein